MSLNTVSVTSQARYHQHLNSRTLFSTPPLLFQYLLLPSMNWPIFLLLFIAFHALFVLADNPVQTNACLSFCGNLTIDYPFALQPGCGHQGFRDLLFCINDVLMFHITSGSYRVLDIDYAYGYLVLHDPHMSTCASIVLGGRGNGFVVEHWRASYLSPTPDNVFMLIGCSATSPLFQGFPGKHFVCGNVSGLGCEEYYNCPAWDIIRPRWDSPAPLYGSGPPDCCGVAFKTIKSVNLSKLDCQGYSSAYSLAPLRITRPEEWAYGIQVKYDLQGSEAYCSLCEATGGSCGYDTDTNKDLCLCGSWNSTSNCDSEDSMKLSDSVSSGNAFYRRTCESEVALAGVWIMKILLRLRH